LVGSWYSMLYLGSDYNDLVAQCRYITSSGTEFWIFVLYDKQYHQIMASYAAPDHPCYGNGGDANAVPHPFPDYYDKPLPENFEIILLDMVTTNELRRRAEIERRLIPRVLIDYDVDMSEEVDFIPRDIDGHRLLMHKPTCYSHRRLVLKQ